VTADWFHARSIDRRRTLGNPHCACFACTLQAGVQAGGFVSIPSLLKTLERAHAPRTLAKTETTLRLCPLWAYESDYAIVRQCVIGHDRK
jgi:hypothetical protein